jgi:hypothetical protein
MLKNFWKIFIIKKVIVILNLLFLQKDKVYFKALIEYINFFSKNHEYS